MSRHDHTLDHVTPYDRCAWSDTEIEQLLVSGAYERELTAYFGPQEYRDLTQLARRAAQAPLSSDALRVYVIPGIMGSQLGRARQAPLPNDVLWLDPMDIGAGQLSALRWPEQTPIIPLGIVLHSYLRLKLQLRIAGFAPVCHAYDWRRSVVDAGRELAQRLSADDAPRLAIVAHSLGGLVSRAALALPGTQRVERVVLLGTPNSGSFAPVQALRGVYAVVRKIARLSHAQSAETLAAEVFSSFPSLYELLPARGINGKLNFFDPAHWPQNGPQPAAAALAEACDLAKRIASADERYAAIVGTGQETVTQVSRSRDQFIYTITRQGDGTVPAVCAELAGARNYYAPVAHSDLPRDLKITQAVAEIFRRGSTRRLVSQRPRGGKAQARISDRQLRATHVEKVDWAHLTPEERRVFLETLNEPPQLKLRVPAAAGRPLKSKRHRSPSRSRRRA